MFLSIEVVSSVIRPYRPRFVRQRWYVVVQRGTGHQDQGLPCEVYFSKLERSNDLRWIERDTNLALMLWKE